MCDPTKTPPGASQSQATGADSINISSASSKPTADEPTENLPSDSVSSVNKPSEKTASVSTPFGTNDNKGAAVTGANTVQAKEATEYRLSPIQQTSPILQKAHDDLTSIEITKQSSETKATSASHDGLVSASSDSLLPSAKQNKATSVTSENAIASLKPQGVTSSSAANKIQGLTLSPSHRKNASVTSSESITAPLKQSIGSKAMNNNSSELVQPPAVISSTKGTQVRFGPPLYVDDPKSNPKTGARGKFVGGKPIPLPKKYRKLKQRGVATAKQSNNLTKYLQRKNVAKKNDITIKLPKIPPCPDMQNYHWPWNCLGEFAIRHNLS